jgi:hypothetical protein
MSDSLDQLVANLADASGNPTRAHEVLDPAAAELRDAASADLPAALTRWRAALTQVGGGTILKSLDLPPIPGLANGLPQAIIAGDAKLVAGWQPAAALGPLVVRAAHTAVTTRLLAAAGQSRPELIGLLPASGVVGELDVGPARVTGAFVVDPDDAGATGHLALATASFTAGALGRVEMGAQGITFIAILGARFMPGIQVGFGFEVSGLGGVIGVNVSVDADELRRRLADGTALNLFFPADPNAREQLLPAARDIFRPRAGSVVAGPSAELTWLQVDGKSMLRLSIVTLLELPHARVRVLGRGVVEVPPMVSLRLDVAGEIDAPRGFYAADLVVVEGRIMGLFRAAGTAALRVSTATPPYTVFTLGGFYPGYRVEVPGLPAQQRLSFGPNLPLPITFRFEGYLAFTGGTFQAGARYEIGFDVSVLSAHGFLSFDAIVQLDPFHLTVKLTGGVDVEALGVDFAGVDFHGTLDAPGPVVVAGRIRVKFLGATAGWNDRFVLGNDRRPPDRGAIEDLAAVVAETVIPQNVSGRGGSDPHVRIAAPSRDGAMAIIHPLGAVRWSQDVVPLEIEVQRARGQRLASPRMITVSTEEVGATTDGVTAAFAPATFRDADRDALLTLPAYEQLTSGVELPLSLDEDAGTISSVTMEYDEVYRTDDVLRVPSLLLLVTAALRERLATSRASAAVNLKDAPQLTVLPEVWSVRQPGGYESTSASRTAAVIDVARHRNAGLDAVALPRTDAAHSTAGLWAAP